VRVERLHQVPVALLPLRSLRVRCGKENQMSARKVQLLGRVQKPGC
jgi:hypothetical protein